MADLNPVGSVEKLAAADLNNNAEAKVPVANLQKTKRLEYLLKQTEKFAEFIKVSETRKNTAEAEGRPRRKPKNPSQPKRTRRNAANENEEADFVSNVEIKDFTESPPFINGLMRDYQIAGLNWLIRLYENGLNGILADEMGLGKTLQTISLLGYLRQKNIQGKHIIFGPKSTVFNWIKEINRWCPDFRAVAFVGHKEERQSIEKSIVKPQKFDILVTNYEMMLNESSALQKINWHYLVVDEGHRLKNENSNFSKATRTLSSKHRLILTGTPLQNNLHELWALLNFLLPDIFSSAEDFDSWFDTSTVLSSGETLVTRLHTILKPFFLRRIKADVEKSLLPKQEIKLYIGITDLQRDLYIKVLKKEFEYMRPDRSGTYQINNPGQILMNLRKICNHPYLMPGVEEPPFLNDERLVQLCGKMQLLDKLLAMLKEQGSKVLIFSQFKGMLTILEDYFSMRNYSYCRLDGDTNYDERTEQMDDFNKENSEKFIFLLSTRAGGLGINLTGADTVIIYDSDWNPQVDIQAEDRAHRIGQTKQVKVFRLISEKTIDERIIQRAAIKLRLDQKVIQEGRLLDSAKIGKSELMGMINYDMEELMKTTKSTITDESIQEIIDRSHKKSKDLEEQVKNSEINFENFDTMFKFDGENYQNSKGATASTTVETRRKKIIRYLEGDEAAENWSATANEEPPLAEVTEYPEIFEFQFYSPKFLEIKKKQYFWYLKKNDITPPQEFADLVKLAEEPSANDIQQLKRESKEGFDWTKDEFETYWKWAKENANGTIKAQIIATRSLKETRQYHYRFWKNFVFFQDEEMRLDCYKALYKKWDPSFSEILNHCDGDFQNLGNLGCKFRADVAFHRFAVTYIIKKIYLNGKNSPNLFQEIAHKLKVIPRFTKSKLKTSQQMYKREPQNILFMMNSIMSKVLKNLKKYKNAEYCLGERETEDKWGLFHNLDNQPMKDEDEKEDSDLSDIEAAHSDVTDQTKTSQESGYNSDTNIASKQSAEKENVDLDSPGAKTRSNKGNAPAERVLKRKLNDNDYDDQLEANSKAKVARK